MGKKILELREKSEEIIHLYRDELMDVREISKLVGYCRNLIYYILKETNSIMTQSERRSKLIEIGKIKTKINKQDIMEIIRLYTQENKSCRQIGEIFNVHLKLIYHILNKNGINTSLKGKPKSEEHKTNIGLANKGKLLGNKNHFYGKPSPMRGKSTPRKGKTYEEYFGEEKAKELKENIGKLTTQRNLENNPMNNSEIRKKVSAIKQGIPLEEWEKFTHFEPYDENFNNKFKRAIRKRDNHICLKCGVHQERLSKTLAVHHIDYNKKLSIPQNCCSLCNKCNLEVNINRSHWTKFFQSLLAERYNYQYSEMGGIILNLNNEK